MMSIVGLWKISYKRKQDFCQEHEISMCSLDYWRRQYNKRPSIPIETESFTKIASPTSVAMNNLELEYPNSVKVKVSLQENTFDTWELGYASNFPKK